LRNHLVHIVGDRRLRSCFYKRNVALHLGKEKRLRKRRHGNFLDTFSRTVSVGGWEDASIGDRGVRQKREEKRD